MHCAVRKLAIRRHFLTRTVKADSLQVIAAATSVHISTQSDHSSFIIIKLFNNVNNFFSQFCRLALIEQKEYAHALIVKDVPHLKQKYNFEKKTKSKVVQYMRYSFTASTHTNITVS